MEKLKDRLYNLLVRKHGRVWYEYERYVREHMEEHHLHRFRHLKILFKLNWFYRVKKGSTPYLYWDVPVNPVEPDNKIPQIEEKKQSNAKTKSVEKKQSNANICESRKYPVTDSVHFAKEFAQYDYVIFSIFGTLLYQILNDKKNFYDLVGKELGIPNYRSIREKTEQEIEFRQKYDGTNNTRSLSVIYELMKNYINVDVEKCVEVENKILKRITRNNPYVKEIYEMVSYNSNKIILVEDSIYSSEIIKEILYENGIKVFQEVLINNECGRNLSDGTMFEYIKEQYPESKILFYSADRTKVKNAQEIMKCKTWQYRDALQFSNTFYSNKMTGFTTDLYRSLVSQHMYCGHYVNTLQYEVGYSYFGILLVGYIFWLKNQIKKLNIEMLLFLENTSDILQKCYCQVESGKGVEKEKLWITQTTVIKILTLEHPIYFYTFFIEQYLNADRSVGFFLEKMDLLCLAEELTEIGLSIAGNINRSSLQYGIFINYLEDKFDFIKHKYIKDLEPTVEYLKSLNLRNKNVAIVTATGNGTSAMALDIILNKQLDMNCSIVEFSGIQSELRTDLLSKEWGSSFINEENGIGSNIVGNMFFLNRTRNILGNIAPVFSKIQLGNDGEIEFTFRDAYPWVYEKLSMNQNGIFDFFKEYINTLETCELDISVRPEEVIAVLEKLLEKSAEYLKNGVVCVRS